MTPAPHLKVLIVEDQPFDAELMVLRLQDEGFAFDWQRVQTEADYLAALHPTPDLILSDWRMPRFSGLRALELLRGHGCDIPFIIVSGSIGEEAAIDAIRCGASDYVLKDRPARLGEAVRRALSEHAMRARHSQAQAQIDFLAHHDTLTRLPNRNLFLDRLEHALARTRRERQALAVLFVDLDRFKAVNDTLGHQVGDALLLEVTRRMLTAVRANDTLARIGGDEFLLLLESDATAQHAATVAGKIIELLTRPVAIDGQELIVTASIGISLYPEDGDDGGTLIRHADLAMYEAKEQGRNNFQFFTRALNEGALERLVMENALRGAVARNELTLHYQPQVDLASGTLVSVEALVRWAHPVHGLVPPGTFIPLAEDIGVIGDIGAWVLQTACRQLVDWDARGFSVPRVAVNLSTRQIDRDGLVAQVSQILDDTGLPATRLELEVTESMLIRDPAHSKTVLGALKALGVHLSVDDFGTGYSSLAYLKLLPLDRLKIDQSFVCDIGRDSNDETIIRAIIALGRSLGLETVAEGVEKPQQAEFLLHEGSQIAQGYHYARPAPAPEIETTWHVAAPTAASGK